MFPYTRDTGRWAARRELAWPRPRLRVWILPLGQDPEAVAIRTILHDAAELTAESWDDPEVQYVRRRPDGRIYAVGRTDRPEWAGQSEADVVHIDHIPNRPPTEFLPASTVGQVIVELAYWGLVVPRSAVGAYPYQGGVRGADRGEMIAPVPWDRVEDPWDECWLVHHWTGRDWVAGAVQHDIVMAAAMTYCPDAALRGECPGVHPEEAARWEKSPDLGGSHDDAV